MAADLLWRRWKVFRMLRLLVEPLAWVLARDQCVWHATQCSACVMPMWGPGNSGHKVINTWPLSDSTWDWITLHTPCLPTLLLSLSFSTSLVWLNHFTIAYIPISTVHSDFYALSCPDSSLSSLPHCSLCRCHAGPEFVHLFISFPCTNWKHYAGYKNRWCPWDLTPDSSLPLNSGALSAQVEVSKRGRQRTVATALMYVFSSTNRICFSGVCVRAWPEASHLRCHRYSGALPLRVLAALPCPLH